MKAILTISGRVRDMNDIKSWCCGVLVLESQCHGFSVLEFWCDFFVLWKNAMGWRCHDLIVSICQCCGVLVVPESQCCEVLILESWFCVILVLGSLHCSRCVSSSSLLFSSWKQKKSRKIILIILLKNISFIQIYLHTVCMSKLE